MTDKQEKGDLAVCCAIASICMAGYKVSLPISESQRYDLIIEKNNVCKTAQVKFCSEYKSGVLRLDLRSKWSNTSGAHKKLRNISDYDILIIYSPDCNRCFYFKAKDFVNTSTICLRLRRPKQMQKTVRLAENYENLQNIF